MKTDENKRVAVRRRTFKGVTISVNGSHSAIEGVLKNMSETGGLLVVKDGVIVPEYFALSSDLDGWKIECQVMRRNKDSTGFRYIGEYENFKPTRHQAITVMNLHDTSQENKACEQQHEASTRLRRPEQKAFGKLGS